MKSKYIVAFALGLFLIQAADAKKGGSGGMGRTENSGGIISVLSDENFPGIFSDSETNTYDSEAGDCVVIALPAADGVDQGRLTFIAPFADCPHPGVPRQLKIAGSGVISIQEDGPPLDGLVDVHFRCPDVFPNESPIGGSTFTSCRLEVREYDGSGGFERIYVVEWPEVEVFHDEIDVRRVVARGGETVFELVPPSKGNGKKEKVDRGTAGLHFDLRVERVSTP